jgi:hypothetical protein
MFGMHGDFFLLESGDRSTQKAQRLPLGETRGRNEAWLRDTLFANPDLLPVQDIEPAYGPLLPLCTELRTAAGPLDIAFINPVGRLTLVECKLWRNAEARRKVVAQVLDYARAIKGWSYADLQRQTSIATGRRGNVPFEVARSAAPELQEHQFIDNVSRSMRDGRFLLLIAGDGIREDVGGIADLINRNATSGFAFGQVEVALYEFPDGGLAVQPRAISRTQLIERHIVVMASSSASTIADADQAEGAPEEEAGISTSGSAIKEVEAAWWEPVTQMQFDDPEQDAPRYRWRNHVRANLPAPGLWLAAYLPEGGAGVFLSGNREALAEAMRLVRDDEALWTELPSGATIAIGSNGDPFLTLVKPASSFATDDEKRRWICSALNSFANALRPRLKALKP